MGTTLPPEAWVVALAVLPEMGPARLRAALEGRSPEAAWHAARRGRLSEPLAAALGRVEPRALVELWRRAAAPVDVAALWAAHVRAGVGVVVRGSAAYPAPFVDDVDPPVVLFTLGDPGVVCGPRVAIVGTRSATRYGLDVAFELGRDLAAAGVGIVSGLALGIDGAAHAGALDADVSAGAGPTVGVVGAGLDVPYPRAHRELFHAVVRRGVVMSEAPLGVAPARWRFPARNRLIAALADVVVVVESGVTGGSMHTVDEAVRRERPVMAVPGPVRSPASAGTNRLLGDCAMPVSGAADVLLALGLTPAAGRRVADPRPAPSPGAAAVLEALGWQPATVDELVERTGFELGLLLLLLDELVGCNRVAARGAWYEQVARADA